MSGAVTGSSPWPFVGRHQELASAAEILTHRWCLVLAGEAGVGKGRLARELLAHVAGPGGHGLVVGTASPRGTPLAALAG